MARSLQEQCHQFLIAEEKRRCQEIEAQRRATDSAKAKPVKRQTILPPKVRSGPRALCQESEFLLMVSEFDYDLSNATFQDYCAGRGVLSSTATPRSHRWSYFLDVTKSWEEFSTDEHVALAEKLPGQKAHKFAVEELRSQWYTVRLGRAKLQDCWEIFLGEARITSAES